MSNEQTPLVSVITAFYNEELFLQEAIESVLQQEYDYWELILVDDGSTDGSTQLAKDFANRFPKKIIYTDHLFHANKGLSASRNAGIAKASGQLVAFLDADDVWLPQKLQHQVQIMQHHPEVAMVCEASEYWYNWMDDQKKNIIKQVGIERDKDFPPPTLAEVLYPLSKAAAPCPSGIIIKKLVLKKHKGFEEHFTGIYQLYEDQAFLHKIYFNEIVYISSACNNRYRQRTGSLVQKVKQDGHYHQVRLYFLKWLQQYLQEHKISHHKTNELLKEALSEYERPNFLKKLLIPFEKAFKH